MKQTSAGNPCLPLRSFLDHTGPKELSLTKLLKFSTTTSTEHTPSSSEARKASLSLVNFSASFQLLDTSVCEIEAVFTIVAWIWTAVWGDWQSLGVFWGFFLSHKRCQQEADQDVRGLEAQHTPCCSPGNHFTVRAALGWWPLLWKSAVGRCYKCQSALGTTENKQKKKKPVSFPNNPQIQPLHTPSNLISISRITEVICFDSWMLRR